MFGSDRELTGRRPRALPTRAILPNGFPASILWWRPLAWPAESLTEPLWGFYLYNRHRTIEQVQRTGSISPVRSEMASELVSFREPPVVEVVLGIQFEPLGLTCGHLGWYWRECLGDQWPHATEAPALPDQIETFGPRQSMQFPPLRLKFVPSPPTGRIQIRNSAMDRMVQVQDTRFVYNWIKTSDKYPRYSAVRKEFDGLLADFQGFASRTGLAGMKPNQWEVTYVNHVPAGPLWRTPAEGANVFPGLLNRVVPYGGTRFETVNADFRSEIPERRGRLHMSVKYQESKAASSSEVLVLHLTARGTVDDQRGIGERLDLGHETIVRAFADVSSEAARQHWGEE